jgi:hypothetical protein
MLTTRYSAFPAEKYFCFFWSGRGADLSKCHRVGLCVVGRRGFVEGGESGGADTGDGGVDGDSEAGVCSSQRGAHAAMQSVLSAVEGRVSSCTVSPAKQDNLSVRKARAIETSTTECVNINGTRPKDKRQRQLRHPIPQT